MIQNDHEMRDPIYMCVFLPSVCVYIYLLGIYKDRYLSLCEHVFNQAFQVYGVYNRNPFF